MGTVEVREYHKNWSIDYYNNSRRVRSARVTVVPYR